MKTSGFYFYKKICFVFLASICFLIVFSLTSYAKTNNKPPRLTGKLVYHTYSDYDSLDSNLYLYNFSSKKLRNISNELPKIKHMMNGDLDEHSDALVFMGILNNEWNIFYYKLNTKKLIPLSTNKNAQNEDPKFSPDGKKIIYKQGIWNNKNNCMIYDLIELNLSNNSRRKVTDDSREDSMPFYSSSSKTIYYAAGIKGNSAIYSISTKNKAKPTKLYGKNGNCSYYPISYKRNSIYFSKWFSSTNHTDQIMCYNLQKKHAESMPFNNKNYDCSDAYPINEQYLIVSSTKPNGKGGYDLYIANKYSGKMWSLNNYTKKINTRYNELGSSYSA